MRSDRPSPLPGPARRRSRSARAAGAAGAVPPASHRAVCGRGRWAVRRAAAARGEPPAPGQWRRAVAARRGGCYVAPVEHDAPATDRNQPGNGAQQRGLAAARRPSKDRNSPRATPRESASRIVCDPNCRVTPEISRYGSVAGCTAPTTQAPCHIEGFFSMRYVGRQAAAKLVARHFSGARIASPNNRAAALPGGDVFRALNMLSQP